jgi:hypothetical protein
VDDVDKDRARFESEGDDDDDNNDDNDDDNDDDVAEVAHDDDDDDDDDELDDLREDDDLDDASEVEEDGDKLPRAKKRRRKRAADDGVPKNSLANYLWTGMVPDVLIGLTRVEKSMISLYNCVTSYGLKVPASGSTFAMRKKRLFTLVQDLAEIVKVRF